MTTAAPRKRYDLASEACDCPPWEGPPRRTILVCTHLRSGSTLLCEALHFTGGLGCALEYYHEGFRHAFDRWGATDSESFHRAVIRNRTDPSGTLSVKLFWRDLVEMAVERDAGRYSLLFDTPPEQVPPGLHRELGELLRARFPGLAIVHLERRDRLRQAVSAAIAADTLSWRAIPGVEEQVENSEPGFDAARIERLVTYNDFTHASWRALFAAMGETAYPVAYEELMTDYTGTLQRLLRHLGSNAAPPPPRMRKQADARSEAFLLRYLRERQGR